MGFVPPKKLSLGSPGRIQFSKGRT